jgi:hypothetical protein
MMIVRWVFISFLLLLVFSAGFLSQLPASFVLKQFEDQLPAEVVLSQPKGTIWHGQVSVNYQGVAFDQLAWQLRPTDVLGGVIKQSLPASISLRHAQDQLDMTVVVTPQNLSVSVPQGQLDIARLAQPFVQQQFMLRGIDGQVHLRDIQLTVPYNQAWLQSLSGRVVLIDLAMMGAQIEQLTIHATMLDQTIDLNVDAEQDGWRLTGTSQLNPPNQFENNFVLNTERPNQFPDWALMTMQQTSPTEARARLRGQW